MLDRNAGQQCLAAMLGRIASQQILTATPDRDAGQERLTGLFSGNARQQNWAASIAGSLRPIRISCHFLLIDNIPRTTLGYPFAEPPCRAPAYSFVCVFLTTSASTTRVA